jgi:TonB-dependent starch-binding outer membrane protein SusC
MTMTATRIVLLIILFIGFNNVQAQRAGKKTDSILRKVDVSGKVLDTNGEGVRWVTVTDQETGQSCVTASDGKFILKGISKTARLIVVGENIDTATIRLDKSTYIIIPVKAKVLTFTTQQTINTGYQQFSQKRNMGPDFSVDQELFQQRVFPYVAPRLEGLVPGLLPVTNKMAGLNQPTYFSIGARTTLMANPDPLIVVDHFPFEGNLASINPDDIADITVLRDPSAAGIWGARAANGVIVIKTKTGKYMHRLRVSFNSFVSLGTKPDLFYRDRMSAADKIFVDTSLFRIGFFDPIERNRSKLPLSPVLEALYDKTRTNANRLAFFDSLTRLDNRHDQEKYFYRKSFLQHVSAQVTGGNHLNNYYFSLGYDLTKPELRISREERKTVVMHDNIRFGGFEISPGFSFTEHVLFNTDGVPEIPEPYELLQNSFGKNVAVPYKRRYAYVDTVGKNRLLDWKYYPLQEFNLRNKTITERDIRSHVALKYTFGGLLKGLEAGFYWQYQDASSDVADIHNKESFFVRDLVNSYSQIRPAEVFRPIPVGHIADFYTSRYTTLNVRFKLAYERNWDHFKLSMIAGKDRINNKGDFSTRRVYGYTENNPAGQTLDYTQQFPLLYFTSVKLRIPNSASSKSVFNNYFSTYLNTKFRWKERYEVSAGVREDKSNLYGEDFNDKRIPLLSFGAAWQMSSERFYSSWLLPFVKLRATYGSRGNSPNNSYAIQTLTYTGVNYNGDPVASFTNPPFNNLQWEKVRSFNLGLNLRTANDRVEVSLDWYHKNAMEVIGLRSLDPTSGNPFLTGNVATMRSRSLDLIIETKNISRQFQWRTALLLSHVKDMVTHTEDSLQPAWVYCDPARFSIVPGKPVYGVYSFAYKGLDNEGNPLGNKNNNYTAMLTDPGYSSLVYHGRATPAFFGSITNDFNWKQLNLSVTLLYKFNYYFRKSSIHYYDLFMGNASGSEDFANRWKTPGDEKRTNVPSMPVTLTPDPNRDYFYNYSTVLVQRADHIRLQNIQLGYNLEGSVLKKLGLRTANLYVNASNIGIIWRANDWKVDPDKLSGYPQTALLTIGFRATFK